MVAPRGVDRGARFCGQDFIANNPDRGRTIVVLSRKWLGVGSRIATVADVSMRTSRDSHRP
jgi:hypothetical protein